MSDIMAIFSLIQSDGKSINLPRITNPQLEAQLSDRRAQTGEIIDQIVRRRYYASLFEHKSGLTFIDLGANTGLVSIYAYPACSRIVAVEPEPATYQTLYSVTLPFRDRIECIRAALAPASGFAPLSVDGSDYSCHTTTNPKPGNKIVAVPAVSFTDLLDQLSLKSVDVCKVDIEGAEIDCLTPEAIRYVPIHAWYIEVHKTPRQSRESSLAMMSARLSQCGYRITLPRPNAIIATG